MQKKILISLILIVLLPICLLAWLGLRMAHNEQQVVRVQVQALVNAQLAGVDEAITAYFYNVQNDLISTANGLDLSPASLQDFTRQSTQVRQVLVIDADGKRQYPAPGAMMSEADKQFMQRTSAIWDNPRIMTQGASLTLAPSSTFSSAARNSGISKTAYGDSRTSDGAQNKNGEMATPQFGWYAWHWNAELHQIFWWRDAQQRLIGFELAPVAVLSDLIARLPATSNTTDTAKALPSSSTRLINSGGQIVYEWGKYQPKPDEKSLAMLPLSHPLGSWKLEYYAPPLASAATANSFGILAAVLLIAAALSALAIYLYREHQREVRVAQQRVNFVNQVSHELKTPLTNIRLYAELLEMEIDAVFDDEQHDGQTEGNKARKYLGIITAESQRLSRLIANVLRFGQFQQSALELRLQQAVVDEVILRCIAAFTAALQAKGIAVQLDLHAAAPVLLDAEALEQILNNLISNAEKYAASGAALHISSRQEADLTSIAVRDFGPGIAARERARIFQPFYRISSKLSDGVTGTGIGLDIARQLARLHGGDLVLQEVEVGACFTVTLQTASAKDIA